MANLISRLPSLAGRNIIVTGAAAGMGKATAISLAKQGSRLSLCDQDEAEGKKALSELRKINPDIGIEFSKLDVSNANEVKSFVDETANNFGRLDGVAHCAGICPEQSKMHAMPLTTYQKVLDVNTTGTWLINQASIQQFLKQKENGLSTPSGGYSIVNTASVAAFRAATQGLTFSAYTISKHAVLGLTRAAASEYGSENIRINCISPGSVLTPLVTKVAIGQAPIDMFKSYSYLGRIADADEIAQVFCFLLSEGSSYVTGASWEVDGGWI